MRTGDRWLMQKSAPSIGRILVAVGFALSCFGLLLFLWIAFGGPVPLKSESYRMTADFPEATTLALESDVRIGGVTVGKVKSLELAPADVKVNGQDATRVEMEIDPEFAPISEDAKAILRQKTLLGETFVELTSGTEAGQEAAPVALGAAANASDAAAEGVESIPEGGHLENTQIQDATQIDEIFNALDEQTRESFQRWQANAAVAIQDRGLDLNDAIGNLGPFITDSSDVLETLERQKEELKTLVRDTGTVFEALTARNQELAGVITNSNDTFDALASQDRALAETFQILPTFERESRLTFERLDEFQANTQPLVRDLIPVARDLSPTLRSVRELAPNLRRTFIDLDKLIKVADRGLPALSRFLRGLGPVLRALDPFLANLNPVVDYLFYQRGTVADFMAGAGVAHSATLPRYAGQPAPRHYLRVLPYTSAESLGIHQVRLKSNRGNGYLKPGELNGFQSASAGIFPNFDCKNTDYTPETAPGSPETQDEEQYTEDDRPPVNGGFAPCVITPDSPARFGGGRMPNLFQDP
jgi:phospholipid/cholesterol/gamma-HCH transport system substrate-binding protein